MAGRYRRNGEAETLGCLVQLLLLLVAMPFVGLYLLINPPFNVKGSGTSSDCFWGCHLDHCFYDEMKPIPTNLKIPEEIEMRALLRDAQDQTRIALEVEEVVYDPKDNKLFLYTTSETCYAVSKVVRANADSIIEELVMKGYRDLTQFESEQDE